MEGSIKVGIPNCKWCPSLAEISIKVSGKFGRQRCCAGSFAYIQYFYCHRVKALLLGAVHLEAEEWKMFHVPRFLGEQGEDCKTSQPNYIKNGLRRWTLNGKAKVCFFRLL